MRSVVHESLPALPRLVGFCGTAGAGKTTAACHLVAREMDFYRFSFADPLRMMLLALGLSTRDFTAERKEQPHPLLCGKSPRFALQKLGYEWGRQQIGEDLWLNAARRLVENCLGANLRAVIDDVRFDNEAAMVRALGGVMIHLARPGHVYISQHASERGVSPALIDHYLEAADVPELYAKLDHWLNTHAA